MTAALLAACTGSSRPVTSTTTDSAGVRITTSSAPAFIDATRWTVDTIPLVDIGGSETDTTAQFDDVPGALLMGDTIVVADGSDLVLRYYDLRGTPLKTVGRKGAGPGEYQNIRSLRRVGDSLLIHDAQQERAALLAGRSGVSSRGSSALPITASGGRRSSCRSGSTTTSRG